MTTTAQMLSRSQGHIDLLKKIANGQPLTWPNTSAGEYRGIRKMYATLLRWGCIDQVQRREGIRVVYDPIITARGQKLLTAATSRREAV